MYLKISQKLETEGSFLILIKIVYETSIILNGERLNALPKRSGTSKDIIPNRYFKQ